MLCVYGSRGYPDPGVRGCVSEDGFTWKKENEFVICAIQDVPPQFMHLGYPCAVELDDGMIVTVYHRFWLEWANVDESERFDLDYEDRDRRAVPPIPRKQMESSSVPWRHYVVAARFKL